MKIGVISLFPEIFKILRFGVTGRAIQNGFVEMNNFNLLDFAKKNRNRVDNRPYGGGPGMVLGIEPLVNAIMFAKTKLRDESKVILVSPQGKMFNQNAAKDFSTKPSLIFVSGRYEGVDSRVEKYIDEEWSVGDYIISGGELASLVMIDALIRMIPGVLGNKESSMNDSFSNILLGCPCYTRPESFQGEKVPEVLLSGDHGKIKKWRLDEAIRKTKNRRLDLFKKYEKKKTLNKGL